MEMENRRFHPRYTRPENGAIIETVDAVRFRVELEDLAVLSPFFESFLSSCVRKPIQLGLVSSETFLFTLDLLAGGLGGGRAPKIPSLSPEFLEELASLTFIYHLAGPLHFIARDVAGPRPHLGNSPNPVTAYTLLSLYQRWVATNSAHLAKQLDKEGARTTAVLGLRFTEADISGSAERILKEYHPAALAAMRTALNRRRELETRLDAIDALPLEEECQVCDDSGCTELGMNGSLEEEDGGDGYVHVATYEEIVEHRRQCLLGPRLGKLEKLKDAALVAHLGYCVLRCIACRRVVRDMVLRLWTYGPLEEWREAWHFDSDFKFAPSDLCMTGHNCGDAAAEPEPNMPSPSRTITAQDDRSEMNGSSGTSRPDSAASTHTASARATSHAEVKDGLRVDPSDARQTGLLPPAAGDGDNASVKSRRSVLSATLGSAASSDGPFRYDELAESDSGSSYGHLPELAEEADEPHHAQYDSGSEDVLDSAPSPSGTVRVLSSPTGVLGVITETEEEYESSRGSFASERNRSPDPVGALLEREDSEAEGDMPAIIITRAEGDDHQ